MVIADLHVHGKYSRGCSTKLDIKNLEKYAKIKGVGLLGTGDFTHPGWYKELKDNLVKEEGGVYYTSTGFPFLLQTELSLIYSQDGKGRRIHNVVLAPSFDVVDQITEYLLKKGRVDYDGRPIFKIPCDEFVNELRKISKDIEVIPAHIWTPHFSLFGEYNQFSKVEECFKEETKHIHAMETGLSSDPAMNWRLSQLDKFQLVSFSDLHSFWPWRLGRESTIFDCKLSYNNVLNAIRTGEGLKGTVEVDPNFGKYHFSGHRNCDVCMSPVDSVKVGKICPKCNKKMIIGVAERIEELADREEGYKPKNAKEFYSLIPLSELISAVIGKAVATKAVWAEYGKLVNNKRSEFDVLLKMSLDELKERVSERLADAIIKNREGKIRIQPGYDGVYGVPILEGDVKESYKPKKEDVKNIAKQKGLGDFF